MPSPTLHIVQVALPLPIPTLFTYGSPEDVPVGTRVRVPFGARMLLGVVTGRGDSHQDPAKLRMVLDVLDVVVPADIMALTLWMSEYYMCSWGEALKAALPPDAEPKSVRYASLATSATLVRGIRQRALIDALQEAAATGRSSIAVPELLAASGAGHGTLNGLVERGIVTISTREINRAEADEGDDGRAITRDHFGPSQLESARVLEKAIGTDPVDRDPSQSTFLLHGVTGSGKTEVYIDALHCVRKAGRSGIVLVPEIALTPQTVARFRRHFGSDVAVLHSRMAAGERFDAWRRIGAGQYRIVIGPRSAILAPVPDLGLVVVDEEHESSYKQFEPAPRYNARDVAVMRAHRAGAVCVLGSATPSLDSFHNARSGKYTLLELPDRVPLPDGSTARLPAVRIVDLLADRKNSDGNPVLSSVLRKALDRRLKDGQQTILLQNRRGYAPVLQCTTCATVPECPDCSVSLTYHKANHQVRCHYCGRSFRLMTECANCGHDLEPRGAGTQRVEEVLADVFPAARVLRMDLDTTGRKDAHDKLLTAFGAGEADILVGTQMVAKGLDFERVTLVGVIDADAGLLFPDFRADERTFQLLTQVAGRAGRAELAGEVIFQTRNPHHPVIRLARRHDFLSFATEALEARQALGYPPFGRAVRVEFRGPDESAVRTLSAHWTRQFNRFGIPVVGPAPAFIARVRRTFRYQALVKADRRISPAHIRHALRETERTLGRLPKGTRINIDVDPMGML